LSSLRVVALRVLGGREGEREREPNRGGGGGRRRRRRIRRRKEEEEEG